MKTTIDFPDDLLHRAKVMAAKQRTTLRELMVRALEQVTDATEAENEKDLKARFRRLLKQMKASNTEPMQPLAREDLHAR